MSKRIDKRLIIGVIVVIIAFFFFLIGIIYLTYESKVGWETIIPDRPPRYLEKDTQGLVWYADIHEEHIESIKGDQIQIPVDSAEGGIDGFLFDHQGKLWVTTTYDYILIRDTKLAWKRFTPKEDIKLVGGISIIDHQGRAWGNFYLNGHCYFSYVEFDQEKMKYSYNVSSAFQFGPSCGDLQSTIGREGNVWVIKDKQLQVFGSDGQWIEKTEIIPSFGGDFVFDEKGNIWIGSGDTDLHMLDQDMSLTTYPGVRSETTGTFLVDVYGVDSMGRVWGEKWNKGIFMFTPEDGWDFYNSKNSGIPYDNYYSFLIDNEDRVWISTNRGLVMFDPTQARSEFDPDTNAFLRDAILPIIFLITVLITVNTIAFMQPGVIKLKTMLEFGLGFWGWLIFTTLFWGSIKFMEAKLGESAMILICCFLSPLPITIISLILFAIKRRRIALGIFSALLINAIMTLMLTPVAVPYSYRGLDFLFLVPFFYP